MVNSRIVNLQVNADFLALFVVAGQIRNYLGIADHELPADVAFSGCTKLRSEDQRRRGKLLFVVFRNGETHINDSTISGTDIAHNHINLIRSGRQGDPGTSRFFLSFEDDMFVIFGGDSLKKILTMFRVSDDMPVEAPQVSEALDKVQRAVEEKYRSIREEIFRFDDVLNSQRKVIYSRRRRVLFDPASDSLETMRKYNDQTVAEIVTAQTGEGGVVNVSKVMERIGQFFPPVKSLVVEGDLAGKDSETMQAFLTIAVDEVFNSKTEELEKRAIAAGNPPNSLGRSANYITLVTMDNAWSDHLQAMENLKEAVILRQYQGRDPVAEYENEAFTLFKGLEDSMRRNAVFSLWQSLATTSQPAAATLAA